MKKKDLEKEIEELKAKIRILEMRPMVVQYIPPIIQCREPKYVPEWFTTTYMGNTCCEGTSY